MRSHLIQMVEKQKEKIIRDVPLLETMTPLIKAEGFFVVFFFNPLQRF